MKVLLHVNYCEGEGRLEDLLKLAGGLPYDGIEFRMKYAFKDMDQAQYRDRLARYKQENPENELVFSATVPFCRGTADEIKEEKDFCLDFFEWASKTCGTKVINFFTGAIINRQADWRPGELHGSAIATEEDYQRASAGLREMAEAASKHGILLALETHSSYLHDLVPSCRKLLDMCGHPAAGINYDQCNMSLHKFASQPSDVFSELGDKIYYAHFKNYANIICRSGSPAFMLCRLSDGALNTRAILKQLAGKLRSGILALECPGGGDRIYAAEQDIRSMRRLMEDLGLQ